VGVSYARAVAQGLGLPLTGVPALEATAAQSLGHTSGEIVALAPSRQSHVYWQAFRVEDAGLVPAMEPAHDDVQEVVRALADKGEAVHLCGEGADRYREVLVPHLPRGSTVAASSEGAPRASTVARLGRDALVNGARGDWAHVLPLYLTVSAAERKLAGETIA